jgi:hypothetical protein
MKDEVHDHWEEHEGFGDGIFEFNGHTFGLHSTMVGDGCFPSNINFDFFVDAGIIGVVPAALIDPAKNEEHAYGHFVDVTRELKFSYDPESGQFVFVCDDKRIEIDTSMT